MNKNDTYERLILVIKDPSQYCTGANRKTFQILFGKFLDEVSTEYFSEHCESILSLRKKVNTQIKLDSKDQTLKILSRLLKEEHKILNRLYQDNSENIKEFVEDCLKPLVEKLYNE